MRLKLFTQKSNTLSQSIAGSDFQTQAEALAKRASELVAAAESHEASLRVAIATLGEDIAKTQEVKDKVAQWR